MQVQAPAQPPDLCLYCRKPLPQPHAKRRRYCKASCRTLAYNIRASQPSLHASNEEPTHPTSANDPLGELLRLRGAHETLEGVASTLGELARRFEAEELTLQRTLEWARSQRVRQEELQRELAQARSQLAERDAELHRLRQLVDEQDATHLHTSSPSGVAMPLNLFPAVSVPERLLDGLQLVGSECEFTFRFGQAQARRTSDVGLERVVEGFYKIISDLRLGAQNLQAEQKPDGSVSASMLRWRLLCDILPAFDNLYRCVQWMRRQPGTAALNPVRSVVEWVLAVFLGVLERARVHAQDPVGKLFDPHLHEAAARVERRDMPIGMIVEANHIGFIFDGKLLRPACVAVACAPTTDPGPSGR